MARRPRGTSPVSVMNTPTTMSSSTRRDEAVLGQKHNKTSSPSHHPQPQSQAQLSIEQQVAALIGPKPVERYGPYRPCTFSPAIAMQTATRLVPDLRWNAVVPLPAQQQAQSRGQEQTPAVDNDVIYICPARFRGRGLPLHLIRYAAQCLVERHYTSSSSSSSPPLTILMNLKDWKLTPRFDVQDWVSAWCEIPLLISAHRVILVNTTASPDFGKLLHFVKQVLRTQYNNNKVATDHHQDCCLPEWVHICNTQAELETRYGLSPENLPNDLTIGKLPMYQLVEDFIHYRQTLEALLERRKQQQQQDTPGNSSFSATRQVTKASTDHIKSASMHEISTPIRGNRRYLRKHDSMSSLYSNYKNDKAASNTCGTIIASPLRKTPSQRNVTATPTPRVLSPSRSKRALSPSRSMRSNNNNKSPSKQRSSPLATAQQQPIVPRPPSPLKRSTSFFFVPSPKKTPQRPIYHRTASVQSLLNAVGSSPQPPPPLLLYNSSSNPSPPCTGRPQLTHRTSSSPNLSSNDNKKQHRITFV